jgi:hypothetical protein
MSGAALVFSKILVSCVACRRRVGRRNVGLDVGEDDGEIGCCVVSERSVVMAGVTGSWDVVSVGDCEIPIASAREGRGTLATSCKVEKVGLSDGIRDTDVLRLDGGSTSCPLSRSIAGPKEDFLGVFARGLKKMPAGWPGGLEIKSPDEGVEPNCTASSEKYSVLLDIPKGEGGGNVARSRMSLVDRLDRSELFLALGGRLLAGDRLEG